jgi:DNA-binding NarL/FixJ family response regulator
MVRQGLKSLLENYPDVQVIGEAGNGEEAVFLIVVMDVNMPQMNGIEATAIIKERHPEMPIIGLSVNGDANTQKAMKAAGALVMIRKAEAVEQLYNQIQETIGGSLSIEKSTLDLFDSVTPPARPQSIGPRTSL